jgi:hypothetical protein
MLSLLHVRFLILLTVFELLPKTCNFTICSIFSNSGHVGWCTASSDTILKLDTLVMILLYKLCVFYVDRNSKMTTTAGHNFYIGPIGSFYNQVNDTGWDQLYVFWDCLYSGSIFDSMC